MYWVNLCEIPGMGHPICQLYDTQQEAEQAIVDFITEKEDTYTIHDFKHILLYYAGPKRRQAWLKRV